MDVQNIKDKDIIKNEVKDLWNKHKLLLIIIIPCLFIIMLALFGNTSDTLEVRFNDEQFNITDSLDDVKGKYKNDYDKEYTSFNIYNDNKKESIQVYYNGSEIESVDNSKSKSAVINGISIGDPTATMAEKLDIDEAWFEDNRITLVCYKDKDIVNKIRMNLDDIDPDKMISEVTDTDYIVAIPVSDSKASGVTICSRDFFIDMMEEQRKADKALEDAESNDYDSDDSYDDSDTYDSDESYDDSSYDDSDTYDSDESGNSVTGSGHWGGGIAE
jgi:hypothetical protein